MFVIISLQNGLDVDDIVTNVDCIDISDYFGRCLREKALTLTYPMKLVTSPNGNAVRLAPLSVYGNKQVYVRADNVLRVTEAANDLADYYKAQVRRMELLTENPETRDFLKKILEKVQSNNVTFEQATQMVNDIANGVTQAEYDATDVAIDMAESNAPKKDTKLH